MVKQEPIIVDSDEDDVPYTPGPSRARVNGGGDNKGKGRAIEVKSELSGSSGLDMQARDAIKVALAKLDAEVSCRPLPTGQLSLEALRVVNGLVTDFPRSRTSSPN